MTTRFPISNALGSHIKKLKSLNSDYEFHLFDDNEVSDYIVSRWGPFVSGIYDSIGSEYFPAKIDLWQYLIIYDKGGVYFDDKSGPVKKLGNIIKPNDQMIISTWGENISLWKKEYGHKKGEFTSWCVIAEPKHPMIRHIISDIIGRITKSDGTEKGKNGVLRMTGPIGSTTTILDNIGKYKDRVKVMKNTFNRKMYFNGMTKSRKFSDNHEVMRGEDRLYSIQETPVVDIESVKSLLDEFVEDRHSDLDKVIFHNFDEKL